LYAALLDFFRAPGKYQLQLREPVVLFASIREVLQIAAGRGPELPDHRAGSTQEAATFFIRAALLYPGADHYAVLGLPPRTDSSDLKERYRLLMRLIHPDFAGAGSASWPTDAAVRVNRAYEVLSSPVLRREYDEQLARGPAQRPVVNRPTPRAPLPRRDEVARAKLRRGLGWTLAIGATLLLGSLLLGRPEPVQLVQRPEEPAAPPAPVSRPVIEEISAAIAEATNLLRSATMTQPAARPAPPAPMPAPARPVATTVALQPGAGPAAGPWAEPGVQHAAVREVPVGENTPTPVAIPAPPPARAEPLPLVSAVREPAAPPAAQLALAPRTVVPAPSLNDVQPLLTQLLERMESGSGEQILRLLNADARNAASAQSLLRQYDGLVRGARHVRLAQVEFFSEPRGGILFVTSRVRLHAGEPTIGSFGERFAVRAEFASRDGRVVLTSLSGAND
jgi:hypothetical protein